MIIAERDTAESIRHRLRLASARRGESAARALHRYVAERFLYRLGQSYHRERLVLKGAALFTLWHRLHRPTRDLDFTAYGPPAVADVQAMLTDICATRTAEEPLDFETDRMTIIPIREGAEYDGLRAVIIARLGFSRIPLQIDLGFGNAIHPGPVEVEFPVLLGDDAPRILAYPSESIVAEKLHAMVLHGARNSRYKDFHDVQVMAEELSFDLWTLGTAVAMTFERRVTPIALALPIALRSDFYANPDRNAQWRAYLKRSDISDAPNDFRRIGEVVIPFLAPVWMSVVQDHRAARRWNPGGPWI